MDCCKMPNIELPDCQVRQFYCTKLCVSHVNLFIRKGYRSMKNGDGKRFSTDRSYFVNSIVGFAGGMYWSAAL